MWGYVGLSLRLVHLQEAIQLDGEIFFALLRRASPLAHRHLRRQRIDPVLYMTEWFMCIFARTLPWASVLRVWDMFFCEGASLLGCKGQGFLGAAQGLAIDLRCLVDLLSALLPTQSLKPLAAHFPVGP